jgi:hypothetical protein
MDELQRATACDVSGAYPNTLSLEAEAQSISPVAVKSEIWSGLVLCIHNPLLSAHSTKLRLDDRATL